MTSKMWATTKHAATSVGMWPAMRPSNGCARLFARIRNRSTVLQPASVVPSRRSNQSLRLSVARFKDDDAVEGTVGDAVEAAGILRVDQQGVVHVYSEEGTDSPLEVILSFLDADGHQVLPIDMSTIKPKPWVDQSGETQGVHWESGEVTIPAGAVADVVVLKIKPDSNQEKEFINKILVCADGFAFALRPSSWVHRSNGGRLFFSSKLALLPQDTPDALKVWRAADLEDIKGSAIERVLERQAWDRIYDYDVYNDLAEQSDDRPILGGSEEFPYPRRIRTGRNRVKGPGGKIYEFRSKEFWIPLNERFGTRQQVNFDTYAVLAALPAVVQKLRTKFFDSDNKLTSFNEVDRLYAKLASPVVTISDGDLEEMLKDRNSTGWLRFPKLFGRLSSIGNISKMVGGITKLLRFPPPAVWQSRQRAWLDDAEYGRQALAGVNPCCVEAVTSSSQLGQLVDVITPHLQGHDLQQLIEQSATEPRLLVIDHRAVFEDYAERISKLKDRYGYSGLAVLYRRDDGNWVPVGIQLKGGGGEVDRYSPADHKNLWRLAKGVFSSLDTGFHQLISHWLRTHACVEPYIIATRRNLSTMHPVFQLLAPHLAFTMQINTAARKALIAANGIIEKTFLPGPYAMRMSSEVYKALWAFEKEALPQDLISRGLAKHDPATGKLQLLLKDYPYADDGMLYWDAIEKWVSRYLKLYYDDGVEGRRVVDDPELVAWWQEIVHVGHADKKEGWPNLSTSADLTQILTTMIWIASGHHAAVNFGQYAYSAYSPNRPPAVHKRIPARDTPAYKDLISSDAAGERVYLETLVDLDATLLVALTVELLSTHADNEVYLGDPDHLYISDPAALDIYAEFVKDVKNVEKEVEARNKDPSRKMRTSPGLPYTYLDPTSKPGLTNRGVPQSISI